MIFGINVILALGLFNLILVIFQLLSGFRVVKVSFSVHRTTGILLCVGAICHGAFAFLVT